MDWSDIRKYVCEGAVQLLLTCGVDAGDSVRRQDQVFVTVADDAVLDIVAFTTLTVAAVLHRSYDHLTIPLHAWIHMHTCRWRERFGPSTFPHSSDQTRYDQSQNVRSSDQTFAFAECSLQRGFALFTCVLTILLVMTHSWEGSWSKSYNIKRRQWNIAFIFQFFFPSLLFVEESHAHCVILS